MERYLFICLLALATLSCGTDSQNVAPPQVMETPDSLTPLPIPTPSEAPPYEEIKDTPKIEDSDTHNHHYRRYLHQAKADKAALRSALAEGQVDMDSVGRYFLHTMRDSMFHYWYGTPWDFNGYSAKPRQGEIACGYFISTPLKQLGLNVNRYKLAQQAAEPIMKSVCGGMPFFRTAEVDSLIHYLNQQPENGLYVLGLSFHVGYVLREDGLNYMVHSDYIDPVAVCKKALSECEAVAASGIFVLGELSHNEIFLEKWLNGTKVDILKE